MIGKLTPNSLLKYTPVEYLLTEDLNSSQSAEQDPEILNLLHTLRLSSEVLSLIPTHTQLWTSPVQDERQNFNHLATPKLCPWTNEHQWQKAALEKSNTNGERVWWNVGQCDDLMSITYWHFQLSFFFFSRFLLIISPPVTLSELIPLLVKKQIDDGNGMNRVRWIVGVFSLIL